MAQRAAALADRFEGMNQQIIESVEKCSDAQWRTITAREGWSVGVVAHHVAAGHRAIAELIRLAATGQPEPAMTLEMLDHANAAHAGQHANCTRAETLELLGRNGAAAAAIVRGLTDEELDRIVSAFRMRTYPSWVPAMSVAQTIERFLIDHVREHLGNIRAAIGPAP
jgi:uncharacterized damage-inducible protein DinB